MIELVVFDLAGTTVKDNRDVHRVLQSALQKFDVEISLDDANDVMGIPKPVAIRELLEKRDNRTRAISDQWIDTIHKEFVSEMMRFYSRDTSVAEKEHASETFRALREMDINVVVDTGFSRPITDVLLKRLGWIEQGLIDFSITSDEVKHGRPHPDMILEAMRRLDIVDASRVAKVGDTVSDLEEGNAAGCGLVVGVTTGAFTRAELSNSKHSHLIEDIAEIVPIILNHKER
jgi:phosphonatase-like hydrolase